MLAEIFLLKLESIARVVAANEPSRPTRDPRFVPIAQPRA